MFDGRDEFEGVRLAPTERPDLLHAKTIKVVTACGNLYVTIGFWDEGFSKPFELFATLGHSGDCTRAQMEAIARSVSTGLQHGVPIDAYFRHFLGIQCPEQIKFPRHQAVLSCADGMARAIQSLCRLEDEYEGDRGRYMGLSRGKKLDSDHDERFYQE